MGVLTGTLSYKRYFVEGELPDHYNESFLERIQLHSLQSLSEESEEERAIGWATSESLLDVDFSPEKIFFNEYLLLTLRIDTLKVPNGLLKAHLIEEERQLLQRENRTSLRKKERTNLREGIQAKLRKQLLPNLAGYDMCWHIDSRLVRFWSHSSRLNEEFVELFEKTFGLNLVPESPYTLAERIFESPEMLEKITHLAPRSFGTIREIIYEEV